MAYVDGFVLPLPKDKIAEYGDRARMAGAIWREHGALAYHECIADDVQVGKLTSFPRSVLLEPGETVVFAWIVYESREHRDQVNAKVMSDPRMQQPHEDVFDGKRLIYGGFQSLVEL